MPIFAESECLPGMHSVFLDIDVDNEDVCHFWNETHCSGCKELILNAAKVRIAEGRDPHDFIMFNDPHAHIDAFLAAVGAEPRTGKRD